MISAYRYGAALLLSCFLAICPAARGAATTRFSYLYVEPNEGDAAGGHAAVRFGDEVFHFQQEAGRFIRLRHDDFATFHLAYAMLGNRPIHETEVEAAGDDGALRDRFANRAIAEDAQFTTRDALAADIRFTDEVCQAAPLSDHSTRRIDAAGLFVLTEPTPTRFESTSIGPRAAAVEQSMRALSPRIDTVPTVSPYQYEPPYRAASADYADAAAALLALRLLDRGAVLNPQSLVILKPADAQLTFVERSALTNAATTLAAQIDRLTHSETTDRGATLLLALARLQALRGSASAGELLLLDAFPDDAPQIQVPTGLRAEYADELERQTAEDFATARREFFAAPTFAEAEYSALETAATRLAEAQRFRAGAATLRILHGLHLPSHGAEVSDLPLPTWSATVCDQRHSALIHQQRDYASRLTGQYGYDLLTRNCVSELITTLAFEADPASHGSTTASINDVAPWRPASFIPVFSTAVIEQRFTATARRVYPSYRDVRIRETTAEHPTVLNRLREGNTWTSTIYRAASDDSAFLLFASDAGVTRPLFGLANLTYGAAATMVGLATAPFDGSHLLQRGIKGIVFSVPELVFLDIRKGSSLFIERSTVQRALDGTR